MPSLQSGQGRTGCEGCGAEGAAVGRSWRWEEADLWESEVSELLAVNQSRLSRDAVLGFLPCC